MYIEPMREKLRPGNVFIYYISCFFIFSKIVCKFQIIKHFILMGQFMFFEHNSF